MREIEEKKDPTWRSIVGKISVSIRDHMNRGDVANLRRYSDRIGPSAAVWKLIFKHVPQEWLNESSEKKWALIIHCLALGEGLHDFQVSLGAGLAHAGYAENRFFRLLEASPDQLPDLLRQTISYLKAKDQSANFVAIVELVLLSDPVKQKETRQKIARGYYATLHSIENT